MAKWWQYLIIIPFLLAIFYSFFPHSIHVLIAPDWLIGWNLGHSWHHYLGAVFLLMGSFSAYLLRKNLFTGLLLAASGTFLLDSLVHAAITTPPETGVYFFVKIGLAALLNWWVFWRWPTMTKILASTAIFTVVFGIYYRLIELVSGLPFGYRVPDIIIGSFRVVWEQNQVLSMILWSFIHGLAFFIPSFLVAQARKR